MATKNLARTIIEGGRTGYNTWRRRHSHNVERTSEREFCNKVKNDPDSIYEFDIKEKDKVHKEFDDKLGPMYRWLRRQVGKPWNEVRSLITQEFDTRTTAGRHIVYDHLLPSVEVTPNVYRDRYYYNTGDENTSHLKYDFFVNDEGILCQREYIPLRKREKIPSWNTSQLANWLGGRLVGKIGNKYFWFIPVNSNKKIHRPDRHWITRWGYYTDYYSEYYSTSYGVTFLYLDYKPIYKVDNMGFKVLADGLPVVIGHESVWIPGNPPALRQGRKLDTKEMEYWNSVPEYYQNKVMKRS